VRLAEATWGHDARELSCPGVAEVRRAVQVGVEARPAKIGSPTKQAKMLIDEQEPAFSPAGENRTCHLCRQSSFPSHRDKEGRGKGWPAKTLREENEPYCGNLEEQRKSRMDDGSRGGCSRSLGARLRPAGAIVP